MTTTGIRLGKVGALLILLATALTLLGGHWASYLVTPVPGLYLVDLLFGVGSLLGVLLLPQRLRDLGRLSWIFVGVWAYFFAFLLPEILLAPSNDRYLAIRDAAPFIYLSLIPLTAATLEGVSLRTLIWLVRCSASTMTFLGFLVAAGALAPFRIDLVSPSSAVLFFRGDLLGIGVGIAIVAWGPWTSVRVRQSLPIQGVLIVTGFAVVESRSGLTALLFAVTVAMVRNFRHSRSPVMPLCAALLGAAGITIQVLGMSGISHLTSTAVKSLTVPSETSMPSETTGLGDQSAPGPTGMGLSVNPLRSSTVLARLETWTLIVNGLTRDQSWLLGGAAGSDYLYELCTGIPEAPDYVVHPDPKCPIDDNGIHPVLRDPHNFALNLVLTHGLVGLAVFLAALIFPSWNARRRPTSGLPISAVATYLVAGLTFIIGGSYALVPIAFFVAWMLKISAPVNGSRSHIANQ